MAIWSGEIKELEALYASLKGQFPELEKELDQLLEIEDPNVVMLYSRRCLEVIITDLCECELNRPRKTEPLKGIIDKLNKEEKVPSHIITSMDHLNSLSTYGAHPKVFDPEQVKPVLNNLTTTIKWYLKYKNIEFVSGVDKKKEKSLIVTKKRDHSASHGDTIFENSIAVLPFANMSDDPDQDYFCDGMTEEIINALTQIESLKVIARTSVFAFKDKHMDMREIGNKLEVETLLEGSIRKADNRIRITAQLIKADDGSHLWSEKFDRELEDIFAIQDEISLAIVDNLKVQLLGEEKEAIVKHHTENLEAYNLLLKGIFQIKMSTAKGIDKAEEYFEQALEKDPNYAKAYYGLASVNVSSTVFGRIPPKDAYPKANEYINKALEIDNTLPEAHSMLGIINYNYYWKWKKAELHFKKALQMNPNSSIIHITYSHLLTCTGRHEEAISEAKLAQELDPYSSDITTFLGNAYYYDRQFDKAIKIYKTAVSINPNDYLAHSGLASVCIEKLKFKKAFSEFNKAFELSDGVPLMVSGQAVLYYMIGRKKKSEKLLEDLKVRRSTEYVPATCFYMIYKVRGEQDLAFEWLERACDEHDSFLPILRITPVDRIRIPDEPRYKALIKKIGLE
jgi:TolB-like protein/Tfp pilus assembly protein PilF